MISTLSEYLQACGHEGNLQCLGRAVHHTGEVDLASPIEEVHVFGLPITSPCMMQSGVTVTGEKDDACIIGINASQCRLPAGWQAVDNAGGVRIGRQANG